jgi:hypothetical protein
MRVGRFGWCARGMAEICGEWPQDSDQYDDALSQEKAGCLTEKKWRKRLFSGVNDLFCQKNNCPTVRLL